MKSVQAPSRKKISAREALHRALMSPIAIALRRGRAAGRRLVKSTCTQNHENPSLLTRLHWGRARRAKERALGRMVLIVGLLLASAAEAGDNKCGWIPICLPAYSPPIDAMRVYVDGALNHERRPMWYPNGGVRTSDFVCGPTTGIVTVTVMQGSLESGPSSVATLASPSTVNDCSGTPTGAPFTIANAQSPSDVLAGLGKSCLSDPTCAQVVLDKCMADAACQTSISNTLKIDVNMDGSVTPTDAALLGAIINGTLK